MSVGKGISLVYETPEMAIMVFWWGPEHVKGGSGAGTTTPLPGNVWSVVEAERQQIRFSSWLAQTCTTGGDHKPDEVAALSLIYVSLNLSPNINTVVRVIDVCVWTGRDLATNCDERGIFFTG